MLLSVQKVYKYNLRLVVEYDIFNYLSKMSNLSAINNEFKNILKKRGMMSYNCLLYTSPSPRDDELSRMPSSA